jgi:ribonuclease Z
MVEWVPDRSPRKSSQGGKMFKLNFKVMFAYLAMAIGCLPQGVTAQENDFVVTTLGTGTPTPEIDRLGPATLVQAGGKTLLFDAGRGVLIQLSRAGVAAGKLDGLFLTHLHSDHINGLPDLFLSGWLPAPFGTRTIPLNVYGPLGTIGLTDGLTKAYSWDIEHRIVDQHLSPDGVRMKTTEIEAGTVFDQDGVKVTAISVNHGENLKPAFGYRVDYDGRSVTISGDTTFDQNLVRSAMGTELLIHQTASAKPELLEAGPAWGLILAHHTTPLEVGDVFQSVKPSLAVLYHVVRLTNGKIAPPSFDEIEAEVKTRYSGELIVAEDMMSFSIKRDKVTVGSH